MKNEIKIMVIGAGTRHQAVIDSLEGYDIYPVTVGGKYFLLNGIRFSDNDLYDLVTLENIGLVVVAGLNKKLSKRWTTINSIVLHGGKVPEYRGASVLNWQILQGEKKIWLSILKLSEGYDEGNILIEKSIETNFTTLDQVRGKIDTLFTDMLKEIIETKRYLSLGVKQNGIAKTWKKRKPEDSFFVIENCSLSDIELLFKASEITYRPFFKIKDDYYQITYLDTSKSLRFSNATSIIHKHYDEQYLVKNGIGYSVAIEKVRVENRV